MSLHAEHYHEMLRRLKTARETAGLRQVEVAAIFRRPQSFVSKVESGERQLDPVELQRLAELYEQDVESFLIRRELPDPNRPAKEQPEFFCGVLKERMV